MKCSPAIRTLSLAALAAALAAPSSANDQLDTFSGDVQVRVVNVDVVVTDKQGRPVTGLGREDFELRLDGKPVDFGYFARLAAPPAPAPPAGAPPDTAPAVDPSVVARLAAPAEGLPVGRRPLDQRLNLVVYLDRSFVRPGEMKDLGLALRRFLHRQLAPGDRVMLLAADRRLEVVHKLTTLVPAVDELLAAETAKVGRGVQVESEYRDILRAIDQTLEEGTDLRARNPELHTDMLMARINAFAAEAYRGVEVTSTQLRQVIAALAGVPGRNVVLYVGGRMPMNAGQTLFAAWQSAFSRTSSRWQTRFPELGAGSGAPGDGTAGPVDASSDNASFEAMAVPDSNLDAGELFDHTARLASASDVTFYTMDAAALRSSAATTMSRGSRALAGNSGGSQWEYDRTQRVASQRALGLLAETTGGRALGGSRDFAALLEEMRQDLGATYSLGFEPPAEPDGETHRIEVRLKPPHKKLRVRHRRELRYRSLDQEAAEATLSALLFGSSANPLGVELAAGAAEDAGGELRVPLTIKVPLTRLALVAESRVHSGKLSVYVTSGDLERGVAPVKKAVVPVRIANEEIMTVIGRHLEYTLGLEVKRGAQTVAVGVRDDFAPLMSTVVLPLAAPDALAALPQGNPP